jgi:hypothetical protein
MHVNINALGFMCCAFGLLGVFVEMYTLKKRNLKVPRTLKVYTIGATIVGILFGLAFLFNL